MFDNAGSLSSLSSLSSPPDWWDIISEVPLDPLAVSVIENVGVNNTRQSLDWFGQHNTLLASDNSSRENTQGNWTFCHVDGLEFRVPDYHILNSS